MNYMGIEDALLNPFAVFPLVPEAKLEAGAGAAADPAVSVTPAATDAVGSFVADAPAAGSAAAGMLSAPSAAPATQEVLGTPPQLCPLGVLPSPGLPGQARPAAPPRVEGPSLLGVSADDVEQQRSGNENNPVFSGPSVSGGPGSRGASARNRAFGPGLTALNSNSGSIDARLLGFTPGNNNTFVSGPGTGPNTFGRAFRAPPRLGPAILPAMRALLPRVPTNPQLPFTPVGDALLRPFAPEVTERVATVPLRFLAQVGCLYPDAVFAISRVPASNADHITTRMRGSEILRSVALLHPELVNSENILRGVDPVRGVAGAPHRGQPSRAHESAGDGANPARDDARGDGEGGGSSYANGTVSADAGSGVPGDVPGGNAPVNGEGPVSSGGVLDGPGMDEAREQERYILALVQRDWPVGAVATFPNVPEARRLVLDLQGIFDTIPGEEFSFLPCVLRDGDGVPSRAGRGQPATGMWVGRLYGGQEAQPVAERTSWIEDCGREGMADQDLHGREVLERMGEAWVYEDPSVEIRRAARSGAEKATHGGQGSVRGSRGGARRGPGRGARNGSAAKAGEVEEPMGD
ncbi:hypothetical protein VTJ04DRAFT_10872 [Mycothermus thermophilus]|uniref:uncharacterized protein n=1 Tax=Humicola insolens TaxID=85995 RepID=UPI0037429B30